MQHHLPFVASRRSGPQLPRVLSLLAIGLLAACSAVEGSSGSTNSSGGTGAGGGNVGTGSSASSGGTGAVNAGGTTSTGGTGTGASANTGGAGGITWPSGPIRPTAIRISDPPFEEAPCAGAGTGTISTSEVLLGQTHLMPPDSPFLRASANRALTVAAAVTGTGGAPAMTATAKLDGNALTLCLKGISALPEDTNDLENSTYRADIPAAWVQPGLEIAFDIGGMQTSVTPAIAAENSLTLYLVDALLFDEGTAGEPSEAQLRELLARLPVSYLEVGQNPFGEWRPEHLLIGPRDDGNTPTGETTSHGPIVVTELPHCTAEDKSNSACTPHSGFATMAGVLSTLDTFREANGVRNSSTWYADLGVALGGGLAGGQRGTGDDTDLIMNHELGHAWGFPHWDTAHTEYPYQGELRNNGGFGDRWAVDQVTGLLLGPECNDAERQSPMQRASTCVPDGSWYDPFSDYESARLLRMNLGAAEEKGGTVPYAGGSTSYTLPTEAGRIRVAWNQDQAGLSLHAYDEGTNTFVDFEDTAWNRIEQSEVPVVMFYGGVIVGGESFLEAPVSYVGNVLRKLDPTDPTDYAEIYEKRDSDFYWARDLVLRFTLDDDTVFSRLYGAGAELRSEAHHQRWAVNLPEDIGNRVVKIDVISRPLGHFSMDSRLTESDSAANYLDGATILATHEL